MMEDATAVHGEKKLSQETRGSFSMEAFKPFSL
jgi:hypothetical protein